MLEAVSGIRSLSSVKSLHTKVWSQMRRWKIIHPWF